MRPLSLKIKAFGPYADETIIPMDLLGDKGLYLITGDTGAGKTTIFDAICFALFGQASGNNREGSMLRSKYAQSDVPTEIELVFLHNGKEYKITRNPEYMRPAKKGNKNSEEIKLTKQAADAQMILPDGEVITKMGPVTAKVEEILGINREQFSQISMLAQGDFLKLLLAETKDRQEIFREIFNTGFYQRLQMQIEDKRKEVYGLAEVGRNSIKQYIDGINVSEDDTLSIEVSKAKAGEMMSSDVVTLLEQIIDRDSSLQDSLAEDAKKYGKELEKVIGDIKSAESIKKAKDELDMASAELEKAKPRETELGAIYDNAKEALKGKEALDKKAAAIGEQIPSFDLFDELSLDIKNTEKKIKNNLENQEKNKAAKAQKEEQLKALQEEKTALGDVSVNIEKLGNQIQKIEKTISDIKELCGESGEIKKRISELEKARKDYLDADKKFKVKQHEYEIMDQAYRDGIAGVLAKDLEEGEVCPVCGATSHPQKAILREDVPTQEEIEEAKLYVESLRELATKKSDIAGKINTEIETRNEAFKASVVKTISASKSGGYLKGNDFQKSDEGLDNDKLDKQLETSLKENKTECDLKTKELETENKKADRIIEIVDLIANLEKSIDEIDEQDTNIKEQLASDNTKFLENKKQIEALKEKLLFNDKSEAVAKKNELEKMSKKLQSDYDIADNNAKKLHEKIAGLKSKIESLQKQLEDSKEINLEGALAEKQKLTDAREEVLSQKEVIGARISTNKDIAKNINAKALELADVEKKLSWMTALSNTASGNVKGKDKIMLETYVQTTYFDRIINKANVRLMTMSNGQYELKRVTSGTNGNAKIGLDLAVTDHYNGSERSVKTLSGGESFMASLSLALGLSDEVQSSAGGIKIDTMFVDEGFGSLDAESLDLAYKALASLTEGNRLVGIISHVADLKNKIDSKIVVNKLKSGGSVVSVEV